MSSLSFTRFIFIVPRQDDDGFLVRLRHAGTVVARGFFNDFDADGTRESAPSETIQFLIAEGDPSPESAIAAARYAVQVTGKPADPGMRLPGSMSWAGIFNTEFWIDPKAGIGGILLMQYLPFYDAAAISTLQGFEKRVYAGYR